MNDGLRNLRAHAADDAVRAHQPRCGDRFQQMLRHQRIHGGHARNIDDRDARVRLHDCAAAVISITTCVRALSSVPMIGSARMPSHNFTTGVESSISSSCCRAMNFSRVAWKASAVISASLSTSWVVFHMSSNKRGRV